MPSLAVNRQQDSDPESTLQSFFNDLSDYPVEQMISFMAPALNASRMHSMRQYHEADYLKL